MEPAYIRKLKTIEEVFKSNLTIGYNVNPLDRDYGGFLNETKFRNLYELKDEEDYETLNFLIPCDLIDLMQKYYYSKNYNFDTVYILKERFFIEFLYLDAGILNPYIEKFQELMDLSFEAGLPKMWTNFLNADMFEKVQWTQFYEDDKPSDSLEFEQIFPIFGVLSIGFLISGFVLLLEIFHFDFWVNFKFEFYWRKFCGKNLKKSIK
jgi:hypothetical protein